MQGSRKGGRIAPKVHRLGRFSVLFFQHLIVKLPLHSQGERKLPVPGRNQEIQQCTSRELAPAHLGLS